MNLSRGRVLKRDTFENTEPVQPARARPAHGRLVKATLIAAEARARKLLEDAHTEAEALLHTARLASTDVRLQATAEGRAEGIASVAARALDLAAREARSEEIALERVIDLSRLLAERLLGEELALAPERVTAIARRALLEARGARRIEIVAHPSDAVILEQCIATLAAPTHTITIEADESRTPGNLRLVTELGVLDAELAPQLDRLVAQLRETLRHER